MSDQTFPLWCDQPGLTLRNFLVTGADVGSSLGTSGLDGRGRFLCEISYNSGSSTYTVVWNQAYGDIPYIFPQPGSGQTNTRVEISNNSSTGFTFQTIECSTASTPVSDAIVEFLICSYNTTSFVS